MSENVDPELLEAALHAARREFGITLGEAADALGASARAVQDWLAGKHAPRGRPARAVAALVTRKAKLVRNSAGRVVLDPPIGVPALDVPALDVPAIGAHVPTPATSDLERHVRSRALASIEAVSEPMHRASQPPIGARVRFLRETYGHTQSQLAAAFGLDEHAVADIEAGRRVVTAAELPALYQWLAGEAMIGPREDGGAVLIFCAPAIPGETSCSEEIGGALAAGELVAHAVPPGWRFVRAASVTGEAGRRDAELFRRGESVDGGAVIGQTSDPGGPAAEKDSIPLLPACASSEIVAAMSYQQLADVAKTADRGPKIPGGYRITELLEKRLERAKAETGLDKATILRSALLKALPPTEDEDDVTKG